MGERTQRKPRMARSEQGFALLIVLWSLALLSLLGATVTATGRAETRIAANLQQSAMIQAAADSAVSAAAFHLLDGSAQHWAADGAEHRFQLGTVAVTLSLRDQGGQVDVNDTSPGLVAALLAQLGVNTAQAATLAGAIVDWRSPGDTGYAARYAAAGRLFAPPHEAVQSLDELSLVVGMTPAVLDAARPYLSLYLGQSPDPSLAVPPVAAALKLAGQRGQLLAAQASQPGDPSVVVVRATATLGAARFSRVATIRLDASQDQPWHILDWEQP